MLYVDCIVPGAGLILRGRLLSGALIMLLALSALSTLAILSIISTDKLLHQLLWPGLAVYASMMVVAVLLQLYISRQARYDQQLVRQLHHDCSQQFLQGSLDQALATARQLCACCSTLLGPWQLLAQIADAQGERSLAAKARRKIAEISASE